MGGMVEINDTLRITREQGFPSVLDYEKHVEKPFTAEDFEGQTFTFADKPKIRLYKPPPVRNFLVEDINGKWLYWGLIHVLHIAHDNVTQLTSGTFKIIYINTPDEMKKAHDLIDRNPDTNFFTN